MSSTIEGFKNTEIGLIPIDWNLISYNDAFDFLTTATYSRAQLSENEEIGYVHYGDIHTKCLHYLDLNTINLPSIKNELLKNYPFIKDGDIIIVDASEDYAGVGKSVEVRNLKEKKVISGLHTFLLRNSKETISDGFKGYINSIELVKKQMDTLATGLKVYGVSKTNLKKIQIPLPPTKAEQTAIATALNDADALITQLEKLIAKKKAIKQVMSSDLLSGRKRLGDNTKKWKEETIESLCKVFTKQTGFDYSAYIKPSLIKTYEEGVLPFIQNKDFYGRKINLNTDYFIPYLVAKNFPRILLDEKCLLISISGSVGHVGVFNEKRHAFLGGAIAVAKFIDKSKIDWAMYFLQSPLGQSMLLAKVKTGSHQNLILDDIRKMIIPYPPKDEMNQIISILFDIDLEIEMLETKLEKQKQLKQGMMQSLLTGKIRLV